MAPLLRPALLVLLALGIGAGCDFDESAELPPASDQAREGRAQAYALPGDTVTGEAARIQLENMLRSASERIDDTWQVELARYNGDAVERRALRPDEARLMVRGWIKAPLGAQVTLQSSTGVVVVTSPKSAAVGRDHALRYAVFSSASGVTVSSETSSSAGNATASLWPNAEILVARPRSWR